MKLWSSKNIELIIIVIIISVIIVSIFINFVIVLVYLDLFVLQTYRLACWYSTVLLWDKTMYQILCLHKNPLRISKVPPVVFGVEYAFFANVLIRRFVPNYVVCSYSLLGTLISVTSIIITYCLT